MTVVYAWNGNKQTHFRIYNIKLAFILKAVSRCWWMGQLIQRVSYHIFKLSDIKNKASATLSCFVKAELNASENNKFPVNHRDSTARPRAACLFALLSV